MNKKMKLYMIGSILIGITVILAIVSIILTMIGVITSESIIWTIIAIPAVIGNIVWMYDIIYMIINNACKKDKK